jgi:hypothetical protein
MEKKTRYSIPVDKISIISRGISALGYTLQLPTEDRAPMTNGLSPSGLLRFCMEASIYESGSRVYPVVALGRGVRRPEAVVEKARTPGPPNRLESTGSLFQCPSGLLRQNWAKPDVQVSVKVRFCNNRVYPEIPKLGGEAEAEGEPQSFGL